VAAPAYRSCLLAIACVASCSKPPILGAKVVRPGFAAEQTRRLATYRLGACQDGAGRTTAARGMTLRTFASSDGMTLVVDRPQVNSLWFERGYYEADAVTFQAVLRSDGVAPMLWDFHLPSPPRRGGGYLRVVSEWQEGALRFGYRTADVVRTCKLDLVGSDDAAVSTLE